MLRYSCSEHVGTAHTARAAPSSYGAASEADGNLDVPLCMLVIWSGFWLFWALAQGLPAAHVNFSCSHVKVSKLLSLRRVSTYFSGAHSVLAALKVAPTFSGGVGGNFRVTWG
jgi:hypothetical protein